MCARHEHCSVDVVIARPSHFDVRGVALLPTFPSHFDVRLSRTLFRQLRPPLAL
jgi:hypothetical protein